MVRNIFFSLCLLMVVVTGVHAGFVPEFELEGKNGESPAYGGNTYTDLVKIEMVRVKGGCFKMGDTSKSSWFSPADPDPDAANDEKPQHKVCVDGFFMGKYEVTQKQWQTIMGDSPSNFRGDNHPVEQVSWDDVQKFIIRLNRQSGQHYRLPTEAEWEYAARSGGKQEKYAGGSDVDAVAWYSSNSGGKTHPVGQKQANGLGLYDMSGNVWEWCSDWYDGNYYSNSPRNNPQGPSTGSDRVYRGGCVGSYPKFVRSAYRSGSSPDNRGNCFGLRYGNLGFRLVLP